MLAQSLSLLLLWGCGSVYIESRETHRERETELFKFYCLRNAALLQSGIQSGRATEFGGRSLILKKGPHPSPVVCFCQVPLHFLKPKI